MSIFKLPPMSEMKKAAQTGTLTDILGKKRLKAADIISTKDEGDSTLLWEALSHGKGKELRAAMKPGAKLSLNKLMRPRPGAEKSLLNAVASLGQLKPLRPLLKEGKTAPLSSFLNDTDPLKKNILHHAAEHQDIDTFVSLLPEKDMPTKDQLLSIRDENGENTLYKAAKHSSLHQLQAALPEGTYFTLAELTDTTKTSESVMDHAFQNDGLQAGALFKLLDPADRESFIKTEVEKITPEPTSSKEKAHLDIMYSPDFLKALQTDAQMSVETRTLHSRKMPETHQNSDSLRELRELSHKVRENLLETLIGPTRYQGR